MIVRKFHELSKTEQRVSLAKTAIRMIEAGKFKATTGQTAVKAKSIDAVNKYRSYSLSGGDRGYIVKQINDHATGSCFLCAVGALQTAAVLRDQTISHVTDFTLDNEHSTLRRYFNADEIRDMELAYEGGAGYYKSNNESDPTIQFYNRYRTNRSRMLAILKNIVANKGTFKP